ncbi:hypothetical protein DB347_16870 [Opitutaceae bacterium EW11]|nr:hypothetical protein DB347_16870 [Opitutaceae bacterium EW11]
MNVTSHSHRRPRRPHALAPLAFFTALFGASSLLAQSTSPASPESGESQGEEIIQLQQFTINSTTDRGYLANNALSATKTNTPLRDLPINMSVITEELLRDLNGVNATDVLEYSPSVVVQHGGAGLENQIGGVNSWQSQIQIRGTGTYYNLRNGFRAYEPPSAIATQRIEIIKGPGSMLYGITKPGGVVNFLTKKPVLGKEQTRIAGTVGSYNRSSVSLDYNEGRLLNNRLGFRLLASYTDTEAFAEFTHSWERAINPSVTVRPFAGTELTAEFEIVDRESPQAFAIPVFAAPGYPRSQVPFYIKPTGPNDPASLIAGLAGLPAGYTERTNFLGDMQKATNKARKGSFTLTQRLAEGLTLNAQFERQRRDHSVVGFSPTLQLTQKQLQRVYVSVVNWNEIDNYSLTLAYQTELNLPWLGRTTHKLVAGVQRQEENYENPRMREYTPGTMTLVSHYIPLSDADGIAHGPKKFVGELRRESFAHEDSDFNLGYISYQGGFLDERLLLIGGVTRTKFRQTRESVSYSPTGPGPVSAISVDAKANSPLVGAIVRPVHWAGLFVQTSKSLNPNTGLRDGFGRPFAPERGDGQEAGVKLDPWDGRLTATISAFDIKELGRIVYDSEAPRQDSFYLDEHGNQQPISGPDDPRYDPNLPGQNKGGNVALGKAVSKGYEFEAIYTPVPSWQVMAAYSYLDAYAARDNNTNTTNYNGQPLPGSIKHQAALMTKYRFLKGTFKGVDLVFGLRYRGALYRRTFNSDGTATLGGDMVRSYAKGDINGDFKIGYETKLWGRDTTFSLNVGNLFGTERWKGFKPAAPGKLATEAYYYNVPETYSFSVAVKF